MPTRQVLGLSFPQKDGMRTERQSGVRSGELTVALHKVGFRDLPAPGADPGVPWRQKHQSRWWVIVLFANAQNLRSCSATP